MQFFRPPRAFRRKRINKVILASKLLKWSLIALIIFSIISFVVFVLISSDLPTPGKLSSPDLRDSTKILDKNGQVLFSFFKDYNRLYVPLSEIPNNLKIATIATEDKDFYNNSGFSIWGYARALRDLIILRKVSGGGSTITQQLVKNVLLTPERSLTRKLKEFVLSIQVDKRFTKDQILEMYLNNVPYGGTAVGVEAASDLYFNKHVKDLDLAESAFLAGLPQAPTYYSPFSGTDKSYIGRTKYVLGRLEADGIISKKVADSTLDEVKNFKFTQKDGSLKAAHFVMYVRKQLEDMYGVSVVEQGNLEVKTTLDYDIQKKAESTLKEEIEKLKGFNVGNGAVVVLDPKTGGILSMVGSKDYFDTENDGNYNAAVQAHRQPGSSLKPIMYATAFEKGYTPATLVMDTKTDFPTDEETQPTYTPVNYDGKYRGPTQIRFALGNSINIPAVKMLARVGIKPVMQKAYDMGIENWRPTTQNLKNVGLSLVLGGRETTLLEITSAYSVFANNGIKLPTFAIEEVKDSKGKVLFKHQEEKGARSLSEEVSFLISHILLDNNARELVFGRSSYLVVPGRTVAVKTGTTDSKRDNWTIGYTPSVVVGVWVGNNDNSPMNPRIASGVTGAAPIWSKITQYVLKSKKDEEFKKPDGVVPVEIDSFSGGLPLSDQPKRTEYFVKGTEPTTTSPIYKKVKISKHEGNKLANQDEIDRGDFDIKEFIVFEELDPVSKDGQNRWQKGIDDWVRETYKDDQKYHPPTETSGYKYGDDKKSSTDSTPTPTTTNTPSATPTSVTPTIIP